MIYSRVLIPLRWLIKPGKTAVRLINRRAQKDIIYKSPVYAGVGHLNKGKTLNLCEALICGACF